MTYVLGIDKGTTMTKAALFAVRTGAVAAIARRPTRDLHPSPDWHEEDMRGTYDGVAAAIRDVIASSGIRPEEIAGVGVSGHMGGLWALDGKGEPAGPAIAWPDARATGLLRRWQDEGKVDRLFEIAGNAPIPGLPLLLLAWLKENDRPFYDRIETVFLAKDYINYRLTGVRATDESDLSLFPCDIRKRTPSAELFELAGVGEMLAKLPPVKAIGDVVGHVTAAAARETGLAQGTPVVTGAGDAVAAAIGVNALESGQAVTVIGTSFMNNLTVDRPLFEPRGAGFLFLMPDGLWQRLVSNTGGGSLCLDWMLRTFGAMSYGKGEGLDFSRIEAEARAAAPADGLIVHPYFNSSGLSAPRFEPLARSSIFGLDLSTGPAALVRAVMEGVALSMIDCYAALEAPVRQITITGGGARSPLWREICASAMNRPLSVPEAEETGALGVALLAARASGVYPTLRAAADAMVRLAGTTEPDPMLSARYQAAYPLFRDLGRDLAPLWALRAHLLERTQPQKDAP